MKQSLNMEFLKKKALNYLGKIISLADRDKFKTSISPDGDWRFLMAIFFIITGLFLCVGGYLYLSTESMLVKPGIPSGSSVATDGQMIKNAALEISKLEKAFEEISAKKAEIADPSR